MIWKQQMVPDAAFHWFAFIDTLHVAEVELYDCCWYHQFLPLWGQEMFFYHVEALNISFCYLKRNFSPDFAGKSGKKCFFLPCFFMCEWEIFKSASFCWKKSGKTTFCRDDLNQRGKNASAKTCQPWLLAISQRKPIRKSFYPAGSNYTLTNTWTLGFVAIAFITIH